MALEVHELEEAEGGEEDHGGAVASPGWWSIIRMQVEVHGSKAEQEPIVETILEDVEEWHRVIRESVNKECLQFSLGIMTEDHSEANFLIECVLCGLAIH